jgi:hypothetical protein
MVGLSPETKCIFLLAINKASHLGQPQLEPEYLLLGLAGEKQTKAYKVLKASSDWEKLKAFLDL